MRKKVNSWLLTRHKSILAPLEFGIIKKERIYHSFHEGDIVRIQKFDEISYACYKDLARQDVFTEDIKRL